MVSEPQSGPRLPRLRRFLRPVRAGILIYVIGAGLLLPGAGRSFAASAVGFGLLVGAGAAVLRWMRRGGLGDLVLVGALAGLLSRGVEMLRSPRR